MRAAAPLLPRVSNERQRDELFRMLEGPRVASALRLMEAVGVLPVLLPELADLMGVGQSPPHTLDVWEHTLALLSELERLWAVMVDPPVENGGGNLWMGMALATLGRFRAALREHFRLRFEPQSLAARAAFLWRFISRYGQTADPQRGTGR